MEIQALGYMGVGCANIDEWSDFATGWLGIHGGTGLRDKSDRHSA
jgi:hypothetical protein